MDPVPMFLAGRFEDLSTLPDRTREETALSLARAEARRPFSLTAETAFRPVLWRLHDSHHILQLTTHHIVSDGWSTRLLERDLSLEMRHPLRPT
jgi:hypothetical protein